MLRACTIWLACGSLVLALSGCARKTGVYPVEGSVLFKGKPAAGARVLLHPDAQDAEIQPHGVVESDGTFKLGTYSTADGAPAGHYAVTVHWTENTGRGDQEGRSRLPARYMTPQTSGISVNIFKTKKNLLPPFDLD